MTLYSGKRTANATLTANTVDTVILTGAARKITVLNISGSASIFFTVSHPGGDNAQPTVNGQNCYVLPASLGSLDVRHDGMFGSVINLISSGTPQYAVEIVD